MFRTALTTYALTAVFAALSWSMPPAILAQLPDAPSAVMMARQSRDAAVDENFIRDTYAGEIPEFDFSVFRIRGMAIADSNSDSAWPRQIALNEGPAATGQQSSIGRPGKQNSGPGFSSSLSETQPVPGAAPVLQNPCPNQACSPAETVMCCRIAPSPFARYLKSPDTIPLTARDNLHSALKNIIDPFNLLTIAGDSAITIASDPDSPYGPGFPGFGKAVGVSFTEDMTGEFFGTFLIPSIAHQDPHYHRQPFVSIKRRIFHAIVQVVWTQSYTGRPMFNYGNIVGGIATAVISNTFVPGPGRQGFTATSGRLAEAFAISPSGNLIEEFLPDLASHINLRVVIFQRILNTVSIEESGVQ